MASTAQDRSAILLLLTLALTSNVAVRAGGSSTDAHSGYTFVIDDLVWFTVFVLLVVLITWAYCAVFQSPDPVLPPCSRPCPYDPNRDRVIRVQIVRDDYTPAYPRKMDGRDPLTDESGQPTAPPFPEEHAQYVRPVSQR